MLTVCIIYCCIIQGSCMWKTYISVVILPLRVIYPTYNSDPHRQRDSTLMGSVIEGKARPKHWASAPIDAAH
jgi:hypothetical protein